MPDTKGGVAHLSKDDLVQLLEFINCCQNCAGEEAFHQGILAFAAAMGCEFVLYCYTQSVYCRGGEIRMVNLSNPPEWMAEYAREVFLAHDPVRHEMERRLAAGMRLSCIHWDTYDWQPSEQEARVIERRRQHGLLYGFSTYCDSAGKDFTFLLSLASRATLVDQRLATMSELLVPHLMATRKRLDILSLVQRLSDKEQQLVQWLIRGKSNGEIAQHLQLTDNTVKFHLKNIFGKLNVANRQQALGILLAERYLSN